MEKGGEKFGSQKSEYRKSGLPLTALRTKRQPGDRNGISIVLIITQKGYSPNSGGMK